MSPTIAASVLEEGRSPIERLRAWQRTRGGRLALYGIEVGVVAGLYYGAGRAGLHLAYLHGSVTALWPFCDQYSTQTGEPPLTLSLSMITCQGTTQARKPERANFDIGLGTAIPARTCPLCKTGNRRREPPFAPPPSRRSRTGWYGSFPWPYEIMPHR